MPSKFLVLELNFKLLIFIVLTHGVKLEVEIICIFVSSEPSIIKPYQIINMQFSSSFLDKTYKFNEIVSN